MASEELSLGTSNVDSDVNGVIHAFGGGDGGDDGVKTARLPRWTRQEILVLIQGKRVAENRVRRGHVVGSGQVEPKWASVSSYCKRHGVNRGPVQCRKRWSNLAGDFKKIKEWESQIKDETESFWLMRNDLRRERKLPGFFDKEVYDIIDGSATPAAAEEPALVLALAPASTSAEEGLFSDFEQEETVKAIPTGVPLSVSEKVGQAASGAGKGATDEKQQPVANPKAGSASQEQRKLKRKAPGEEEEEEEANRMQHKVIEVLERSSKMLETQLEAQNSNLRQDREQRKDIGDSLVAVLNKLADVLGRIADKL
ncbi:PREDICTED: trihelix transcription factor ASR3-like [Tarenaya hassleriana]|uniref:trihelix transcription factor ASR3-like n=1 Tax=Tarenaya hassleriana TaxID=28532 RepID=UPI00053C0C97|nr:PREDICTED: trihelix transcription factor ASR3-like [Tarenaya hassleriana]